MSTGKAAVFFGPGQPTYPLERINEASAESEWHAKDTTRITRAALAP